MSPEISGILIGAGSTLAAAFVIWAVSCLRRRANLPSNVGQLRRGEYAIFQVLEKQGACMAAILSVNETILDVIQKGKINGNIIKAVDKNTLGGKHLEASNDIVHEYLRTEAVGCVGEGAD